MHDIPPTQRDAIRSDVRAAIRRDERRMARREQGHRRFWQSLRVIGMVGWPIALGSVGGTLLGRWFDLKFATGIHFTLILMMVGVLLGCAVAWKTVVQE